MDLNFRTLKAEEIDVRVGQITYNDKTKGCSLLLYKDARVDMALLDEVCKPFGWSREHKELKDVCYCGVGIKDTDTGEWVFKWDAGSESKTEKEKGEASDSFKRACVNWGIGRELYTAPFIWVNLPANDFVQRNGNYYLQNNIKFSVKEIGYDDKRQIKNLVVIDNRGAVVFTHPKTNVYQPAPKPKKAEQEQLTLKEADEMFALFADIDATEDMNQLKACVTMSLGQRYEKQVRAKANERAKQKGWA